MAMRDLLCNSCLQLSELFSINFTKVETKRIQLIINETMKSQIAKLDYWINRKIRLVLTYYLMEEIRRYDVIDMFFCFFIV